MPASWFRLVPRSAVDDGSVLALRAGGTEVALLCVRGELFAIDDRCPHAETRMSEGRLRGSRIICPLHGAAFDVRDGRVLSGPARQPLRTYPVRVEDGVVEVLLPDPQEAPRP